MSTPFRIETWSKWYPFDSEPTADEWKSVHHLAPVPAVQAIKRARIVANGLKEGQTAHPNLNEIRECRLPQNSLLHQQKILESLTFIDKYGSGKLSINSVNNSNNGTTYNVKAATNGKATRTSRATAKESNNGAQRNISATRRSKAKRKQR